MRRIKEIYKPIMPLWSKDSPSENLFDEKYPMPIMVKQRPKKCIAACLAIVSAQSDEVFDAVNSLDPYAWSIALQPYKLKLAFCSVVPCSLRHYIPELIQLNGLFILSLYTGRLPEITANVDAKGNNGAYHTVVIYGDKIYDPCGTVYNLSESHHGMFNVKNLFRVVDSNYARGI
jgi:hypothetical protein